MGRIDVHQHLLPDSYVEWLRSEGLGQAGGRDLPAWSAHSAITLMDARSIATGILSISTPGTHLGDDAQALDKARQINDLGAELVKDRPDRFGYFATIPLPYVDGAVHEAVRALDELGADGVVLLANNRGTYLGDPAFEPLMTELDRRSAVVFVHPSELPAPAVPGLPPFAADFLLDTTRAAANLVLHGVPRRYPSLKIILSHAGGFLPYAAHRIAVTFIGEGRDPGEVFDDLTSFYFDTALSGSPTALPSLLAFARPGHVLYGSDWPFAPDLAVKYFTDGLDAHEPADTDLHHAIDSANARALFPRLT